METHWLHQILFLEGLIKVIGRLVEGPKVDMTSYAVDSLLRIMTAPAGD